MELISRSSTEEPLTSATLLEKLRFAPPDQAAWTECLAVQYPVLRDEGRSQLWGAALPDGPMPDALLAAMLDSVRDLHVNPRSWQRQGFSQAVAHRLLEDALRHFVPDPAAAERALAAAATPAALAALAERLDAAANTLAREVAERLKPRLRNEESWGRFFARYSDLIDRWCANRFRRHVGDRGHAAFLPTQDIEDVAASVKQKLLLTLPTFEYHRHGGGDRPRSFRGFLSVMIQNAVTDWFRDKKNTREQGSGGEGWQQVLDMIADPKASEGLADELDSRMTDDVQKMQAILTSVLGDAEPKTREAFLQLVVHDRKATDVAAELDMKTGAVYQAAYRLKQKLREEWESRGFAEL
jgi:RNA polymerase sigma factor (sigma-70 family)